MKEEIAVLLDEKNKITSFDFINKIYIYEKKEEGWFIKVKLEHICLSESIGEIQKNIVNIIAMLNGCNIILGKVITGICYHILDRNGILMCEAKEYSKYLFDEILKDQYLKLEKVSKERDEKKNMLLKGKEEGLDRFLRPMKISEDGTYLLDLYELQKLHPEISSKKVMIPFLSSTVFYELQVICSHVMPWLDQELKKYNLTFYSEPYQEGRVLLVIKNRVCDE